MALTYLGLGSNLGNKQQNLNLAVSELILYAGNILKVSSFYETTPWGFASENSFLNAVVLLETNYAPLVT
jgi:2-amino-4-hydroxy-6-hydroxymethyldihydropteridine diphosphokinase